MLKNDAREPGHASPSRFYSLSPENPAPKDNHHESIARELLTYLGHLDEKEQHKVEYSGVLKLALAQSERIDALEKAIWNLTRSIETLAKKGGAA